MTPVFIENVGFHQLFFFYFSFFVKFPSATNKILCGFNLQKFADALLLCLVPAWSLQLQAALVISLLSRGCWEAPWN